MITTCEPGDLPSPEEPYVPGGVHREEGQPERWSRFAAAPCGHFIHASPSSPRGKVSMHIMEGYLPPIHAAAWTVAAAPFVVAGVRRIGRIIEDHPETKLLLATSGAFAFVLSALKIPSVTGSCSHPTGAGRRPVRAECDGGAGQHRAAVSGAAAGPWRDHHAGRQRLFNGDRRSLGRLGRMATGGCCRSRAERRRVPGGVAGGSGYLLRDVGPTGAGLSRSGDRFGRGAGQVPVDLRHYPGAACGGRGHPD